MSNMSTFQIVLLVGFGTAAVVGVLAFALFGGGGAGSGQQQASLTIWGTMRPEKVTSVLRSTGVTRQGRGGFNVTYKEKDADTFDTEFVNALAEERGPDIIILPHTKILKHRDKLWTIPYKSYQKKQFTDRFVRAATVFMRPDGIVGLPLTIDPMVMYWNRPMLRQRAVRRPPQRWSELNTEQFRSFIQRNGSQVSQSLIPMGEYDNVTNAKGILSTLMLQSGTPVVDSSGVPPKSALTRAVGRSVTPGLASLQFYTQFADTTSALYNWNSSLPSSQQTFLATDSLLYLGYASEYQELQQKNPNLDFGVELIPQSSTQEINQGPARRTTYAWLRGLAITQQSGAKGAALEVISRMTGKQGIKTIARNAQMPPVRKDVQLDTSESLALPVFIESALIADAWLEPAPERVDEVFRRMINAVQAGRLRPSGAIGQAHEELNRAIRRTIQ